MLSSVAFAFLVLCTAFCRSKHFLAKTPGLASRPRAVPYYGVSDAIPAMHVSLSGVAERIQVSKEVLAATLQLQLRDMRLVDIEYDSQLKPYILVGQSCLSFAVGGIKVIAGESGVYVFGLDDSETANVVSRIQLAAASSAGGAPVPPLAHVALNEALLLLCEFVIVRLDRATWLVDELADVMKTKMTSSELSAILELRTRPLLIQMDDIIRMVNTYISAIEGAINLVSETGKFCHSEALLEHHLSTMSRLESMFHNQLDRVTKNNEIIGNALKLSRLRVEQAQLVASFASLTIAAGAFVTGIYGMNLKSGWENSYFAFYGVSTATVSTVFATIIAIYKLAYTYIALEFFRNFLPTPQNSAHTEQEFASYNQSQNKRTMESLTAYLSNISLAPTYDGLENPMSRLIKDLTDGVYTSEEAAIERIINSQDKVALLNYFPGRFKKLIHFAASQGYNNLIKFILLQTIDSGYNMSDYLNSLDSNLQTPLRLARQNGHTETSNLLMSYGSIELYPPLRVRCKKCENCFVVPSNVIEECTSSHRAVPHVCNKCKTKRTKHKIGSKKTKIQINKKKKQKVNNGRNVVVTKVQRVILPVQKKKPISYTKK